MTPSRFTLTLAYNGAPYCGFQEQRDLPSVQGILQEALKKILGEKVVVIPAGRTDTGVHALKQTVHFDVATPKALKRLTTEDVLYKLNCILPSTILITKLKKVPTTFHVRKVRKKKTYRYHILFSAFDNPFVHNLVWRLPKTLDEKTMKTGARHLIGRHDFTSFCASDSTDPSKVKEIFSIKLSHQKPAPLFSFPHEKYLTITVDGSGFLKQMVRNIVGTLVAVGQKKITPDDVKTILAAKDRKQAYQTAPAQGLTLVG
jgi:tRNA pseudouridine38-40 synthase